MNAKTFAIIAFIACMATTTLHAQDGNAQTPPPMGQDGQTPPPRPPMPPFDPAFPDAHDPVMAKEGDTFYIFSTGLQELTTKDFRTYEKVEPPFREPASWVRPLIPQFKRHFWAPDVIFHGGKWHLFYCCSIFGKNVSVIGRMTRSTLDVSSDEPWKDEGLVIRSVPMRDNWNAIDPNIAIDVDSGRPWMVSVRSGMVFK